MRPSWAVAGRRWVSRPMIPSLDVGGGLADEARPATDRTERVDDPVVLGEVARVGPLHGHAADRIQQHDVVDGRGRWRHRGARRPTPASVAGPGDATKVGRPTPDLHELGQDGDRDLLGRLGAQVHPGRRAQRGDPFRPEHRLLVEPLAHDGGPGRRGDETDVRRVARERGSRASSSQMPWVAIDDRRARPPGPGS